MEVRLVAHEPWEAVAAVVLLREPQAQIRSTIAKHKENKWEHSIRPV